jgi:hypothetical protein
LEYAVRKYDGAEFRAKVLSEFSGSLCVDEIHLGHRVVLLASDPVSDNPIACALVSKNDAAHMLRFLRNLKNHGFSPQTGNTSCWRSSNRLLGVSSRPRSSIAYKCRKNDIA